MPPATGSSPTSCAGTGPTTPCSTRRARRTRAGSSADRVWIIDPLDGTREFGEPGRHDWAVHVALWDRDHFVAGAVALPARRPVLTTDPAPVAAADVERERPRIITSRTRAPYAAVVVANALGCDAVRLGSAGAKAMAVVLGEADIYLHDGGMYQWDSAAPAAVALAAGLHVSRIDGSPIVYNDPRSVAARPARSAAPSSPRPCSTRSGAELARSPVMQLHRRAGRDRGRSARRPATRAWRSPAIASRGGRPCCMPRRPASMPTIPTCRATVRGARPRPGGRRRLRLRPPGPARRRRAGRRQRVRRRPAGSPRGSPASRGSTASRSPNARNSPTRSPPRSRAVAVVAAVAAVTARAGVPTPRGHDRRRCWPAC